MPITYLPGPLDEGHKIKSIKLNNSLECPPKTQKEIHVNTDLMC